MAKVPEERRSSPVLACTLKLAIPHGCPSSSLPGASNYRALQGTHQVGMDSTNLIVNSRSFSRAASNIGLCIAFLAPLTLGHDLNSRTGLVSDLRICCTNTECNKEEVSDPYSPEAKALNLRSALSTRIIGKGRAGLESFCGVMDMLPPVTAHTSCAKDLQGSSPSMECEGAVELFSRSQEELHLR